MGIHVEQFTIVYNPSSRDLPHPLLVFVGTVHMYTHTHVPHTYTHTKNVEKTNGKAKAEADFHPYTLQMGKLRHRGVPMGHAWEQDLKRRGLCTYNF